MKTLAERQRPRSLSDAVKWLLARQLSGDRPDILAVARGLGVGERSLQRRLGGEGTSFQVLLNAVRRARGRELLADPALDIDEVAFLLGYEPELVLPCLSQAPFGLSLLRQEAVYLASLIQKSRE
jgi:AraC-like DNA-binding protein